ncbi:MAG: glycosyltransferase family 4 protein [Planctomycetota bacterium]
MVAVAQVCDAFAYGTAKSIRQLCNFMDPNDRVVVFHGMRQGTKTDLEQYESNIELRPLPGKGPTKHLTNMRFLRDQMTSGFDVIHGHSAHAGIYVKWVSKRTGVPALYSPRGYAFLREDYPRSLRVAFRVVERMTVHQAQTVACGPYEASLARAMGADPICINNGFQVHAPLPPRSPTQDFILGVGRICYQKGFDLFLETARRCPEQSFFWVGDVQKGVMERWGKVPENLTIQAYVPHDELLRMLRDAYCIFLPSRWEGLSRFLIESACFGKSLITSTFPGNMDCLGDKVAGTQHANGFACSTVDEYVDAVNRLCDEPGLLESMQQASHAIALERFDIGVIAQAWRDLYQQYAPEVPVLEPKIATVPPEIMHAS